MPTGRNVHGIPKLSLHNGKELAQQAPSWRQPTWWFADGSPLRLLEWELQGGVQWLEAILQRILLVEFYQLLQRKQQDRCSPRGPAHNGDTAEGATSNSSCETGPPSGLPGHRHLECSPWWGAHSLTGQPGPFYGEEITLSQGSSPNSQFISW